MSNYYFLSFKKMLVGNIPMRIRTGKMIAWLNILSIPITSIHNRFLQKRKEDHYKLNHTGQVFSLRKVLNDAFDNELRRIEIGDGNRYEKTYIYTKGEQKPKFLGKIYIYDNSVFDDTGADFLVLIPIEVWNQEKTETTRGNYKFYEMEALIDFYKIASKRYKIQIL